MGSADRSLGTKGRLRAVPRTPADSAPPLPDDETLIAAVRSGDDRIAGQLYDRVIGVVDRTLFRVFGTRGPDHDDLIQATFEQLVITLAKKRFAGACSLTTWASAIASHVGLNALRVARRERKVREQDDPSARISGAAGRTDVENEVAFRFELLRVRDQLAAMDPAKASAVLLHDVVGHDLAEIAVLTGVSVAAVQSRLVRGRRELHRRVEADKNRDARDEQKGGDR